MRSYIDVEVERSNLQISCPNRALPRSSEACQQPVTVADLKRVMKHTQWLKYEAT